MAKYQEILDAIKHLTGKLYGENGFEGDITEIKHWIDEFRKHFEDHSKRITVLETQALEKEKASVSKLKTTGKYTGIISAIAYIAYSLGTMAGWW